MHKILIIILNLLLLSNSALAFQAEHLKQLKQDLNASEFSGFILVADKDNILVQEAFGSANVNSKASFNADTQIDIGSVTKTFVGLVAAKLIEAGKLHPEHTLEHYFPDVPQDKKHISVHQLLTHSAGFPGALGDDYEQIDNATYIKQALNAELLFEPGAGYEYSNVGFSLIATIISQVTGLQYEQWLQELLLKPLGLERTGYSGAIKSSNVETNMSGALVTDASWGGNKPGWHLIGNGGLLSTPADLLRLGRWMIAHPNATMVKPYVEESGGASHYGYGIVLQNDPVLGQMHWHNGGNNFFYTDFFLLPERQQVVILHSNNPQTQGGATARLLATLKGQPLPAIINAQRQTDIPSDTAAGNLSQAFLAALVAENDNAWISLLKDSAHPEFLAMAPMEEHVNMYLMLHDEFSEFELLGYRDLKDNQGGVAEINIRTTPNNATYTLSVHYQNDGDNALITGIGVE